MPPGRTIIACHKLELPAADSASRAVEALLQEAHQIIPSPPDLRWQLHIDRVLLLSLGVEVRP